MGSSWCSRRRDSDVTAGAALIRIRARYLALALGTIALGLLVHLYGGILGAAAQDFAGDALWGAMIAWWIAVLAPATRLRDRAIVALVICFAVEASQLYHTPTLDAIRSTTPGHLVLGGGFDPRDLVAYTVGVLAAATLERATMVRASRRPTHASGSSAPS